MTLLDDEIQVRELLAPLNRVEPVTLPRRKRTRRPVLIAGFLAAALLATGVAIAEGVNPFAGIGAADHAQTPQDVLDPATAALIQSYNAVVAAQIQSHNAHAGSNCSQLFPDSSLQLLPDTARLIGQLPSGRSIYVVTTTSKDELCLVVDQASVGCGAPLTQTEPTTIETFDQVVNGPDATPPLAFGVAQDGITAVSFMGGGSEHTVPITNNVWAYEGDSDLRTITVHYADGTTQTISH
jgi:hypothetical protein